MEGKRRVLVTCLCMPGWSEPLNLFHPSLLVSQDGEWAIWDDEPLKIKDSIFMQIAKSNKPGEEK